MKVCGKAYRKISGDNSERDPPVPIPNTEVKPLSADGTWLATARESRTSPGSREGKLEERELLQLPYRTDRGSEREEKGEERQGQGLKATPASNA